MPPLASLGGVSAVVMAVTMLGTALAAALVFLAVRRTPGPVNDGPRVDADLL